MAKTKKTAPQRVMRVQESGERLLTVVGDDPETMIAMIRLMDAIVSARPRRRNKKST